MPELTDASIPTVAVPKSTDYAYLVDPTLGINGSEKILIPNLLDVFNVKHYGAVGDGFVDDTVAIQALINTVEAAGGGKLYLPAGTFLIGSAGSGLVVNKSYTVLDGAGKDRTTIKTAASMTTGVAVTFASGILPLNSGIQSFAGLSNLTIESGTTNDLNTCVGLWIEDFVNSRFINLRIKDFSRPIRDGAYMNYFESVRAVGTGMTNLGLIGWEFYGTPVTGPYPAQTTIIHCASSYYTTGLQITDSNTLTFIDWDVERCALGLFIGPNVHNISFDGNSYWESLGQFFTFAGSGSLRNELVMNVTLSGFWNPLLAAQGFIPTTLFGSLTYCRNIAFRDIHMRRSFEVAGDKFTIGPGVEDISIENCNEEFDQLMAPNYITSINGPLDRTNRVINGNFKLWSLGPNVPPDGWYIDVAMGSTATVAQIDNDKRDGNYVAEVTGNALGDFMWAFIPIPVAYQKPGVTATLIYDVQLRDSTLANIKLSPTDDVGVLQGTEMERGISNDPGTSYPVVPANTWITRSSRPCIIGAGATQLRVRFYPDVHGLGHKSRLARVGVYFGSTGWAYEEAPFDARSPVHSDVTAMTYTGPGTSTTELGTWLMDRRTLRHGSWGIRIRAAGTITGIAGAKSIGIKIVGTGAGSNIIAHIDFLAGETDTWYLDVTGYRKTAALLACFIKTQKGTTLVDVPYAAVGTPNFETQSCTISVYATLAGADTVTKQMFIVEMV